MRQVWAGRQGRGTSNTSIWILVAAGPRMGGSAAAAWERIRVPAVGATESRARCGARSALRGPLFFMLAEEDGDYSLIAFQKLYYSNPGPIIVLPLPCIAEIIELIGN